MVYTVSMQQPAKRRKSADLRNPLGRSAIPLQTTQNPKKPDIRTFHAEIPAKKEFLEHFLFLRIYWNEPETNARGGNGYEAVLAEKTQEAGPERQVPFVFDDYGCGVLFGGFPAAPPS